MKIICFCLLIISASLSAEAFQADKNMTSKINIDDGAARQIVAAQPDFTANATCTNYENTFGHGFGESFKLAKKGGLYRRESAVYIDYAAPGEPPVRYQLKTKKYDAFTGDAENHLWFTNVENPALLALDETLRFEIVGESAMDLRFNGRTKIFNLIKIKVTGETDVGGDWDLATVFLYVAPTLKNLVVKTELIFPKEGRSCTLKDVSLTAAGDGLFAEFAAYRLRQIDKILTLPKAAEVAKIEFDVAPSQRSYFTEKSLLEALPRFIPGGSYRTKMTYQTGTMTLNDGTVLNWSADGLYSLRLTYNRLERYFLLPQNTRRRRKNSSQLPK